MSWVLRSLFTTVSCCCHPIHLIVILLIVVTRFPITNSSLLLRSTTCLFACCLIATPCSGVCCCCCGCLLFGHLLHDTDLVEKYLWLVLNELHFLVVARVHVVQVSQILLLLLVLLLLLASSLGVIRCSRGLASEINILGSQILCSVRC